MTLIRSWIDSANAPDTEFPTNNLHYGVFSIPCMPARCGAICGGDMQSRGALPELSWAGTEPVTLNTGETRNFLKVNPHAP